MHAGTATQRIPRSDQRPVTVGIRSTWRSMCSATIAETVPGIFPMKILRSRPGTGLVTMKKPPARQRGRPEKDEGPKKTFKRIIAWRENRCKIAEKKNKPEKACIPAWQCPVGPTTEKCGLPASCVNCYHFGKQSCLHPAGAEKDNAHYIRCFSCKHLKPEFIAVKCGR